MPNYSATDIIEAPPELVWGFLANVTHWPQYLDTFESVEPLDNPQLAIGARFRVLQPGLRPAVWKVILVDPPRQFIWQAESLGMGMLAGHGLDRIADGRCRLRLDFGFSGPLGWPLGLVFGGKTRRFLHSESMAFKRLAEQTR